jgi:hypothetical protein
MVFTINTSMRKTAHQTAPLPSPLKAIYTYLHPPQNSVDLHIRITPKLPILVYRVQTKTKTSCSYVFLWDAATETIVANTTAKCWYLYVPLERAMFDLERSTSK